MAKLHSSGIEEYKIYSSGSSGNFRGMRYPRNSENPKKIPTIFEKENQKKNFSLEFLFQSTECLVIIPNIDW